MSLSFHVLLSLDDFWTSCHGDSSRNFEKIIQLPCIFGNLMEMHFILLECFILPLDPQVISQEKIS